MDNANTTNIVRLNETKKLVVQKKYPYFAFSTMFIIDAGFRSLFVRPVILSVSYFSFHLHLIYNITHNLNIYFNYVLQNV